MTAQEIFNIAFTLMFGETGEESDYSPFWINTLNFIIAENYKTNNALRVMRGKEALTEMPLITDMTETVNFEDEYTRHIFPMGCAGYIYTDDDKGLGQAYKNKYEYERSQILGTQYETIEEVEDDV